MLFHWKHFTLAIAACIALTSIPGITHAEPPAEVEAQIQHLEAVYRRDGQQKVTAVMLLGVFHFEGSETDTYSQGDADMLSPNRQNEIGAVLDALEDFAPTKIGVEVNFANEGDINADYALFRAGELELTADEVHQLGFRLANRLGHDHLYAIDADGRSLDVEADLSAVASKQDQLWLGDDPIVAGWDAATDLDFEWTLEQPLRDALLRMNDPRSHKTEHSFYLTRYLGITDGEHYPRADAFVSKWYNRNIRIFGNILRVAEESDAKDQERLLIIIGNGHVPILKHLAENSGSLELVSVASVLADSAAGTD
ncbi:MAG: DUF5694 domain-containing protein [Pseudomonadota bacterium]